MHVIHFPAACLVVLLALACVDFVQADAGVDVRIESLSQRIEQSPGNQALYLQRSLAYAENNEPDRALQDILIAESVGNPVDAAFTHGVLLFDRGEYTAARPYFDRYLKAYPRHRRTLDYRARLLRDIGENRAALADYESLIELSDSLDPGYYLATARLMASLSDRGADEALALLDRRMAQRGPVSPLQRYAIMLEKNRAHYSSAIERMTALDQRLKATPQWKVEIAELLMLDQRPEEASFYLSVAQEQLQDGKRPRDQALLKTVLRLQGEVSSSQAKAPDQAR
jgi:tetratricopeptide (TPR) repeat protein